MWRPVPFLRPGRISKWFFPSDDANLNSEGAIARIHPGSGVAIQFKEMSRESREKMYTDSRVCTEHHHAV